MTLFRFNHETYACPKEPSGIAASLARSTLSSVMRGRSRRMLRPDGVARIWLRREERKGPAVVSERTAIMSVKGERSGGATRW